MTEESTNEVDRLATAILAMALRLGASAGYTVQLTLSTAASDHDPWAAMIGGHRGTGLSAEMALLQLHETVLAHLKALLTKDKANLEALQERVAFVENLTAKSK